MQASKPTSELHKRSSHDEEARREARDTDRPEALPTEQSTAEKSQVDRVADKAHDYVDTAAERARDLEQKVKAGAESTQETLSEQQERASKALQETRGEVERFVRERPLASAGIAFAAGLVAARILRN